MRSLVRLAAARERNRHSYHRLIRLTIKTDRSEMTEHNKASEQKPITRESRILHIAHLYTHDT